MAQNHPHLREFLDYCQLRFRRRVVWSAGGFENVHMLCSKLEKITSFVPDLILTKLDTKFTHNHPYGDKDLIKVYEALPGTSPMRTFIVDDHDSNFDKNPDSGILIPEFVTRSPAKVPFDVDLVVLMEWFSLPHVVGSKDVRLLDKTQVFESFKWRSVAYNSTLYC